MSFWIKLTFVCRVLRRQILNQQTERQPRAASCSAARSSSSSSSSLFYISFLQLRRLSLLVVWVQNPNQGVGGGVRVVCKKRRGEEKEVKVEFSHFCSFPLLLRILSLLQENGRHPKKEDQKKRRPGRERKWVRRSIVNPPLKCI